MYDMNAIKLLLMLSKRLIGKINWWTMYDMDAIKENIRRLDMVIEYHTTRSETNPSGEDIDVFLCVTRYTAEVCRGCFFSVITRGVPSCTLWLHHNLNPAERVLAAIELREKLRSLLNSI